MPEVNLTILPEERGVELLTKQIRVTGRAYPLFDIARLVLQKEDRYQIEFSVRKNADGTVVQPLFACALDDTLWLTEDDAVAHILDKHLATFYEVQKTPTDPPKGTYTFVAQCGMSGAILGPPNYHDYQNKLRQLHAEKFSRMPFDMFKSRVKIVRDEEIVKQWIDEQSFKTEYVVLNVPEPLTLGSFEDVQKHFHEIHLASMVKSVEKHAVAGDKSRRVGSRELQRLAFRAVDDQKRFPLKLVTTLSQKFSTRGLQFFKVNKTVVHVAVARPHFLDLETTTVSDGVKRIVDYVNEHTRCSVKELVDFLAPKAATEAVSTPAEPAAANEAGAEETAQKPEHPQPTLAQKQVLADLHWLVHQGHVIEFASGELETAKKPNPKPQPKKKPQVKAAKEKAAPAPPNDSSGTPPTGSTVAGEPVGVESISENKPAPASLPKADDETGAASNDQATSPVTSDGPVPATSTAPHTGTECSEPESEPEMVRPNIDGSAVNELQITDSVSDWETESPTPGPGPISEPETPQAPSPAAPTSPNPEPITAETGKDKSAPAS